MLEEARKNLLSSRLQLLKQGIHTDCVFLAGSEDKKQASYNAFSDYGAIYNYCSKEYTLNEWAALYFLHINAFD
jgi:hypothetical protein